MTDILLVNGDIGVSQAGEYDFAKGMAEILQKAILSAKIHKGSFIYNKDLGTELFRADVKSPRVLQTATVLLNEALISHKGVKAEVENISLSEEGGLKVLIAVTNDEETRRAEVTVNADV